MKDADDWDFILNTVDALFYRLSNGIASPTGLSLVDSHEGLWASFAQGCFKLRGPATMKASASCHAIATRIAAPRRRRTNG
jgi:hypothetical protein